MKILFILSFVFYISLVQAQDHSFMVYSVKGNVNITQGNAEFKARIGNILDNKSIIHVQPGGVITMICDQVTIFTIKKNGTYPVSVFKDSCKQNNSSITANYLRYVWTQMAQGNATPTSNRKLFMNTVGAVSRSVNNIWIDPRLDTIIYASGSFPLAWKSYAEAKEFEFSLFESLNDQQPVFIAQTDALQMPISSLQKSFKSGKIYYWTSAIKGEKNEERKVIKVITGKERDAFINHLRKAEAAFESEAEEAFRLGFHLEESHYLADAYSFYQKAAELQPAVVLYRNTLMAFRKDYDIR